MTNANKAFWIVLTLLNMGTAAAIGAGFRRGLKRGFDKGRLSRQGEINLLTRSLHEERQRKRPIIAPAGLSIVQDAFNVEPFTRRDQDARQA